MASYTTRSTRSRRTPIRKKPTSASVTSLFSSITKTSNGSSGSNSTVTQESVSRGSRQRPAKSTATKEKKSSRHSSRKEKSRTSPPMSPVEERANVFAFMEEEEEVEEGEENVQQNKLPTEGPLHQDREELYASSHQLASNSSTDHHVANSSSNQSSRYVHQHEQWDDGTVPMASFNSDSGISVRSSSPERESPVLRHKFPSNRAYKQRYKEYPVDASPGPVYMSHTASSKISDISSHGSEMEPESFYKADPQYGNYVQPEPVYGYLPPPHNQATLPPPARSRALQKQPKRDELKKTGYDLLASSLSGHDDTKLKPVYRRFETLHNRMLLYLQDEISELEIDLKNIETLISGEAVYTGMKSASRRAEAKQPSTLQWHRMDIIGRIFAKLDLYNRALSTYSNLLKGLDTASPADVDRYKEWILEHTPVIEAESAFLDVHADLVTIIKHGGASIPKSPDASAVATGFAVLLTIIAFKLVPQFCSRLVIGAIVGIAMLCSGNAPVISQASGLKDYGQCISIYAAIILILAVVVG